jgi:hypothetical protein
MNKIFYSLLFALLVLGACNGSKDEEKAIQKEVLDSHDQIMGDDEKAMVNKMKLDTLIQKADSLKLDKKTAVELSTRLTYADNRMSDWMGKINLDNGGKNHDDIMKYWAAQKKEVKQIDSLLLSAVAESGTFIEKVGKK